MKVISLVFLALGSTLGMYPWVAEARQIYLNGVDASNLNDVVLEKVTLHISASGDIFITAPHYEIEETFQYRPLQEAITRENNVLSQGVAEKPEHKPPMPMDQDLKNLPVPESIVPKTNEVSPSAELSPKPGVKAP